MDAEAKHFQRLKGTEFPGIEAFPDELQAAGLGGEIAGKLPQIALGAVESCRGLFLESNDETSAQLSPAGRMD